MNNQTFEQTGAIKLQSRLPENWERAYGYTGQASWLLAYWTLFGDEAVWEDGRATTVGANWQLYLDLRRHLMSQIAIALAGTKQGVYELGSSENEASYGLLFDLQSRSIYVAPLELARGYLEALWPKPEPIPMSTAQVEEMVSQALSDYREQAKTLQLCRSCYGMGWLGSFEKGYRACSDCGGQGVKG